MVCAMSLYVSELVGFNELKIRTIKPTAIDSRHVRWNQRSEKNNITQGFVG